MQRIFWQVVMRGQAMARICRRLSEEGVKLAEFRALEFFARQGDWQTTAYADKVRMLEAWEIDPAHEAELKKNLPHATIRIGDSFEMARDERFKGVFDLIVFDNPQGLYGRKARYCEHFEAIEMVNYLLSDEGIVIFNINHKPFDFDKHPEWRKRRETFYGCADTSSMSMEFLLEFYHDFFSARRWRVSFSFAEHRNTEYLAYLVFGLARIP